MMGMKLRAGVLAAACLLAAGCASNPPADADVVLPEARHITATAPLRAGSIAYRAEVGERVVHDASGQAMATMFSIAYIADAKQQTARPITFVWNGGPGAASFILREHLGPTSTKFVDKGPEHVFVDNVDSILDVTDLVFIDPPGTGYSRVLDERYRGQLWGIEQDGRIYADFIRDWLRDNAREASPKYIMGESYGGMRVGQVAKFLAEGEHKVALAGAILVSPGVKVELLDTPPAAVMLPSQAATAWAHKLGDYTALPLDAAVAQAEVFAAGEFSRALADFDRLSEEERLAVARKTSGFTGIPVAILLEAKLAVLRAQFQDTLLAARARRLDIYDGRLHSPKPSPNAAEPLLLVPGPTPDAVYRDVFAYKPAIEFQRDHRPIISTWDWKATSQPAEMPEILADLIERGQLGHVFLAGGYFDLAVWYRGPEQSLQVAGLPADRFQFRAYPSGHGVYEDEALRVRATNDLRAFYVRSANSLGKDSNDQ